MSAGLHNTIAGWLQNWKYKQWSSNLGVTKLIWQWWKTDNWENMNIIDKFASFAHFKILVEGVFAEEGEAQCARIDIQFYLWLIQRL